MKTVTVGMTLLSALILSSCVTVSMPSAAEAGLKFSTRAEPLPTDLNWNHVGVAHELINIQELIVVVSAGSNPMSDEEWRTYQPSLPWVKNIERNLLFSQTVFLRSPGKERGASGDARYTFRELAGHTWVELARPVALDFIPAGEKTDMLKPAPGHLVVKTILKPQIMRWDGTIWRLTDNHGNFYVMHATETGTPELQVSLPSGWSLEKVVLDEPLILTPSEGGYYNVVGDCLGQGYHQYRFSTPFYPIQ